MTWRWADRAGIPLVACALLAHGCLINTGVSDSGIDAGVDAGGPYALFGGQFVTATPVPFEQAVVVAVANAQSAMAQSRWNDVDTVLGAASPVSALLTALDATFAPAGGTTITSGVHAVVSAARAGDPNALDRWGAWIDVVLSLAIVRESMLTVSDTTNGVAHWDRAAMYASGLVTTFNQIAASRPVGLFCPAACPLAREDVGNQIVDLCGIGRGATQPSAADFLVEDATRLGVLATRVMFVRAMERAARVPVRDADRDTGALYAAGVAEALVAMVPGARTASAQTAWAGASVTVRVGPALRGFGLAYASAGTVAIGGVTPTVFPMDAARPNLTFSMASGVARGAVDVLADALTTPGHDVVALRNEVLSAQQMNDAMQGSSVGLMLLTDVMNTVAQVGSP